MAEDAISVLPAQDLMELRWAYRHLEHPSFAARLSDVLASPFEGALTLLPKAWNRRVRQGAELTLRQVLAMSLSTLDLGGRGGKASDLTHQFLAAGAGAVGGFFGPLTVLAELPVTTALMMRSIGDVARSQGEDLTTPESRLACFQVFALGGRSKEDDDAEIGYYGIRISLGLHFERILEYAGVGAGEAAHIPVIINLVRAVAARFGVVISDKLAAQMVPVAGAAGGALINLLFMQHYQDMARGHFIIRRLERVYGMDTIKREYQLLADEEAEDEKGFSPVEGF